jgi:uncharacterized protein YeaO (DUF488 family)
MHLHVKRAYEPPAETDGRRILVDRLWPRGLTKQSAAIDFWAKAVAPSNDLRRWYQHDPAKWAEFRKRYFQELEANPAGVRELLSQVEKGAATLVFSSKEERLNNAVALREYLLARWKDGAHS